jgi:hypothetical protein
MFLSHEATEDIVKKRVTAMIIQMMVVGAGTNRIAKHKIEPSSITPPKVTNTTTTTPFYHVSWNI